MIAKRVDRRAERLMADFDGKPASEVELHAVAAMKRTLSHIGPSVARELNLDPDYVGQWCRLGTGKRGPHLTLLFLTQLALEWKRDRHDALAALDFVEHQLGRIAFDAPPARATTPAEISHRIAACVIQLGEFLELAATQEPTAEQIARAHQEKQDVLHALEALLPAAPAQDSTLRRAAPLSVTAR